MEKADRLSLMAVFAHPDDESFGNAGTLTKYSREGVFTALVTATRGEAGEISDPALATPDTLGQVREQELRQACSIMGVRDLRLLDYLDGTLPSVDRKDAVRKIVRAARELRPQVILTFGPDGVYGHPDHVTVSRWATDAFKMAGNASAFPEQLAEGLKRWTPLKLYYVAPPRQRFRQMWEMAERMVPRTAWADRDWSTFGVPEERITTCVDVRAFTDSKLSAIASHQTQIQPSHPYAVLPRDVLMEFFSEECYVLAESRVGRPQGRETDLFQGIREMVAP